MVSTITYNGDGATRIFPVSFKILGEDYIRVYVDSVQINDRTTYDIINNSIVFNSNNIPPVGEDNVAIIVATSTAELGDLSGSLSAIDTVAANIDNVTSVADNIDLLINTANGEYLVAGLPPTASIGDLAVNVLDGKIYEYQATGWVVVATSNEGGGTSGGTSPVVPIEPTLPPSGTAGEFIYNTTDGQFYVYIDGKWKYITAPPTEGDIGIVVVSSLPAEPTEDQIVFLTTDNKLYRYTTAGGWAEVISPTGAAAEVADASITTAKFASGITPVEVVATLPTTDNFVGRTVVLTTDGKLYRYAGSSFTAAVPTTDLTGTIGATLIAPDAITTEKIAAGAITADEIGSNAITSDKITANAITTAKISAGAIGASQIAAGAITTEKIYAGAVAADKIAANAIDATKIVSGAITSNKLAANSVTAGAIVAGAISTYHLGANVVTANQIAAGAVTASKLTADAIVGKTIAITSSTSATAGTTPSGYSSLSIFDTSRDKNAVAGINRTAGGYAVSGVCTNNTSSVGVHGVGNWGVLGEALGGGFGFYTAYSCYFEGANYPFTGSHMGFTPKDIQLQIGDIVTVVNGYNIEVNNSVFSVLPSSTTNDKKVVGVFNGFIDSIEKFAENSKALSENEDFTPLIESIKNTHKVIGFNALGEGGINVCNQNGNIEIGDYICTSSLKGKGMKQDDDLLHNYTVAKALESVDWSKETTTTKMIACTYHCG